MAYETRDPYLKRQEDRYAPGDRSDSQIRTSRTSVSSAVAIALALILTVAVVSLIAFARIGTTDPRPASAPEVTTEVPQPGVPQAAEPAPAVPADPAPAPAD